MERGTVLKGTIGRKNRKKEWNLAIEKKRENAIMILSIGFAALPQSKSH